MMQLIDYDTVIWDWNGTIIDDVELCYEIYMEQRELFGLTDMDLDTYRYHFQFPVEDFYLFAGFTGGTEEYESLAMLFISRYNEKRYSAQVHEGAKEVLEFCMSCGIDNYILSAYESNSLVEMVSRMNYRRYFKGLTGLQDVKAGSKTAAGKEMLDLYGLNPSKTLYIGDTVHDYDVANSLGIDVVLTTRGHNSRRRLEEECSTVLLIDTLRELLP